SDIFSFGVMLYEMATGCRPFRGEAASETVAAVLRDTPPAPSSLNPRVPEVLDKLIAGCLDKDASRRIQTARELRLSLQALAVGLSAPALSFPTDTTPLTRLRRRWAAPAAALAGTCCLVLMLAATRPQLQHLLAGSDKAEAAMAGETAAVRRPGLAVLPLGNFSKDPEYFVDGMTDALIASLSDIQGVRVISRQSVMRFKSSSEPLPAIARELGVEIIVQGSVMRAGNRVRITAQLLRADPEQQIWARSYERDMRDVLTLQNEVARAISREIQVKLEPADERRLEKPRPVDPQAYDAYLKGRHAWNQRTAASFASALELFQEALRRDPKLALAHAAIADVYSFGPIFGFASPAEAFPQARKHAEAALQLDPDLADAYVSLGVVHLFADRDWDMADARLRRALALSPNNPMAHQLYSIYLVARGRRQEVLEQNRLHYELDPLSPTANVNVGVKAYEEGRKDEAIRHLQKAMSLAPGFFASYLRLSDLYRMEGKRDLELETFQKSLAVRYPQ
ncbi:MAG: protein kinase, partial [Thermoanaerobaculia bacterium]